MTTRIDLVDLRRDFVVFHRDATLEVVLSDRVSDLHALAFTMRGGSGTGAVGC